MKHIVCATRTLAIGFCVLLLAFLAPRLDAGAETLPPLDTVTIRLADPACAPGKCLCRGSFEPDTWQQWYGPHPAELAEGIACLVADFDGNGADDYALPGAEGMLTVVLFGAAGFRQAVLLDAGGLAELYPPRATAGEAGEPPALRPGLLIRHVGQNHNVYLWQDDRFAKISFPASGSQ